MADSSAPDTQESLEESQLLSSEEWTFIDKKESKPEEEVEEKKVVGEDAEEPKESAGVENAGQVRSVYSEENQPYSRALLARTLPTRKPGPLGRPSLLEVEPLLLTPIFFRVLNN